MYVRIPLIALLIRKTRYVLRRRQHVPTHNAYDIQELSRLARKNEINKNTFGSRQFNFETLR